MNCITLIVHVFAQHIPIPDRLNSADYQERMDISNLCKNSSAAQ